MGLTKRSLTTNLLVAVATGIDKNDRGTPNLIGVKFTPIVALFFKSNPEVSLFVTAHRNKRNLLRIEIY